MHENLIWTDSLNEAASNSDLNVLIIHLLEKINSESDFNDIVLCAVVVMVVDSAILLQLKSFL